MTIGLRGIADALKPPLLIALVGVSGLLLFGPSQLVRTLGLAALLEKYRPLIGIIFLVATALTAIAGFTYLRSVLQGWYQAFQAHRRRMACLQSLTPAERSVLAEYIVFNKSTTQQLISDGVAQGLVHKTILYRSTILSDEWLAFGYNLQPWASKMLRAQPELLEPQLSQYEQHAQKKLSPRT